MTELRSFARYVVVAAVVGVITVGLREVFELLLAENLHGRYGWTMLLSYAVGVVLSYFGQARLTFGTTGHRLSHQGLAKFAVVACISALLTTLVAYVLRYGLPLQARLPTGAAALAFAMASLLVAPISFFLGRQIVFVKTGSSVPQVHEPIWVWLVLLAGMLLHAAMVGQILFRYDANSAYDSALFMQLAQSLATGQWLGPYTALTLVKGPGFAFWLAGVHALRLPISWAAAITYSVPCLLIFLALRSRLQPIGPRLVLFVALLLCPFAFSTFEIMRELIYPALALWVVACGLGLALRLERLTDHVQPWLWATALGLSSALLALTREETIWLWPLWLAVVLRAGWLLWQGRIKAQALLFVALVSGLTGVLPMLVVASLNQQHYGVFTVLELNTRPFTSAYGALARVRTDPVPQIPVPRTVWTQVAAVSPSFAELNTHLQGEVGRFWAVNTPSADAIGALIDHDARFRRLFGEWLQIPLTPGSTGGSTIMRTYYDKDANARRRFESLFGGEAGTRRFFASRDEIGGGWFLWALRESARAAGYHADAREAARFYQQLASEVNAACDQGRLSCDPERHTLRPPLLLSQGLPFLDALITVSGFTPQLVPLTTAGSTGTLGTREQLASAEAFFYDRLAPGQAELALAQPFESLIHFYRHTLPWMSAVALFAWLLAIPLPRRQLSAVPRLLWWLGLPLLAMVFTRLALVALIHVASWPVIDVRYMSAAYPLLVMFDVIGCLLVAYGLKDGLARAKTRVRHSSADAT